MKKYIIYGAGGVGQSLASYAMKKDVQVKCIVDSDKNKQNREIEGLKVLSPEEAFQNIDGYIAVIAVTEKYIDEIQKILYSYGFTKKNIIKHTDIMTSLENISDMEYGEVSGYIPHVSPYTLLKSAYKNKILVNTNTEESYLVIHEDNEKYFGEVYEKIIQLNQKNKWIRNIAFSKDNLHYILEKVSVYSYATEWPPEMYKDMCLFYLEFLFECSKINLTVDKLSYRDVIFSGGAFLYENIQNIKLGDISYDVIEKFVEKFITPILLMQKKIFERAFWFIGRDWEDMSLKDVIGYFNESDIREYNKLKDRISTLFMTNNLSDVFLTIKQYISTIDLKFRDVYQWDRYQAYAYETIKQLDKWSIKQKTVIDMIKETNSKTMIDLAGNMGWYAVVMKDYMTHTIVADIDYNCIDFAYEYVKMHKIKNVYPIHLNLITPPLDTYKNMYIGVSGIEPWTKNAIVRYKSDVAIALAILHHLVFSQQLSFDEAINQMALFTNRYLIIEFINRDDRFVKNTLNNNKQFDWYTEENFVQSLEKYFKIIRCEKSLETRNVYLCLKKA